MLTATTRLGLAILGAILVLAGLAAAATGAGLAGIWLTIVGVAMVVALLIERQRYRSDEADGAFEPHGPGGGEPGPLEPRFRPTDEVFVDPTTQHRMRVHVDPRTGERRYVAET
jgi:hypothetical protein